MEHIEPRAAALRQAMAGNRRAGVPGDGLVTISQACEYLRVSRMTLYRQLIWPEKLKTVKLGRRVLIRREALLEVIEQHES